MPVDSGVRASDADRDHVAAVVGEHTAEGRLTIDEMQQRTDAAYAARTLDELQRLVADLPGSVALPAAVPAAPSDRDRDAREPAGLRARWVVYCAVCLLCVVIWLGTSLAAGAVGYFWPAWVIGPWGAALAAKTLLGRPRHLSTGRQ